MARVHSMLVAAAVGAAAAYFLDPEHGAGRRERLLEDLAGAVRHLRRRPGAGGRLERPAPLADDDLSVLSRVESALLGIAGVPRGSIETEVVGARVVLRGAVTSAMRERQVVEAAGRVPGVAGVESRLRVVSSETGAG